MIGVLAAAAVASVVALVALVADRVADRVALLLTRRRKSTRKRVSISYQALNCEHMEMHITPQTPLI